MTPISAIARLAPLLPVPRPAARSVAVAEQSTAAERVPARTRPQSSEAPGAPLYGVAAYLAAGRLAADRLGPEARLELSTRVLVDGGRVSVARRFADGRTVGIEAVVG